MRKCPSAATFCCKITLKEKVERGMTRRGNPHRKKEEDKA